MVHSKSYWLVLLVIVWTTTAFGADDNGIGSAPLQSVRNPAESSKVPDAKITDSDSEATTQDEPLEEASPEPLAFTSETRRVKVAIPGRSVVKDITYYKNSIGMEFVKLSAGAFTMGSPSNEKGHRNVERPQHRVRITHEFYMSIYEVTQKQYKQVMRKTPSRFKGSKNPVESVTWNDALDFCRQLSRKTGMNVRLPTEAEWEYACRAGTTTPFYTGRTIPIKQARYKSGKTVGLAHEVEAPEPPAPVGSFLPNAFGLYDMHGNVCEWCADWYGQTYYRHSPTEDPTGPTKEQLRVWRGGSWMHRAKEIRSAYRYGAPGGSRFEYVGFRVIVVPNEEEPAP